MWSLLVELAQFQRPFSSAMTNVQFFIPLQFSDKVSPYKQLAGGVEMRAEIPKAPSGKILRRILKQEFSNQ